MGVLQETKLTDVHCIIVGGREQAVGGGGVALVWREDAGWQVEGIVNFVTNVESFLLT